MAITKIKEGEKDVIMVIGQPRAGKTYLCEQAVKNYQQSGKPVIVYNYGKKSDWSEAGKVDILDTSPLWFRLHGKEKKHVVNASLMYKHCRYIKIAQNSRRQNLFFESILLYHSGAVFFDDAGVITRHGLPAQLLDICGRANHTGMMRGDKKEGADLFFLFHSPEQVNSAFWRYCTKVVLFSTFGFDGIKTKDAFLDASLRACHKRLKTLPKYSFFEIDRLAQTVSFNNLKIRLL